MENDMNVYIKYKTYKMYKFLLIFFILMSILSLVFIGDSLKNRAIYMLIVWGFFFLLFSVSAKYCYDLSKLTILFESEGIRLINVRDLKEHFISYQKFLSGYYCRSYRGHLYLVLSPELLTEKQVKKMVNRSVWLNTVYIHNAVLLLIHNASKEEKILIKEIVSEQIPSIMVI